MFSFITSVIVIYALVQFVSVSSAMEVSGPFGNRNVLGAYLALALPLVYGLGLYEGGLRSFSLCLTVMFGASVILSGGALIAVVVAVLVLAAIKGRCAFGGAVVILLIGVLAVPAAFGLLGSWSGRQHLNILRGSTGVYVGNNFLLSHDRLLERAKALNAEDRPGEAERLLMQIPRDEQGDDVKAALDEAYNKLDAGGADDALGGQVAARYKRWAAACELIWRRMPEAEPGARTRSEPRVGILGVGAGNYQTNVNQYYGAVPGSPQKMNYGTDEVEVFNIGCDEPDTFNLYLVTAAEIGLIGLAALVWVLAGFIGRAARLYAEEPDALTRGMAFGAMGALIGFAVCSIFNSSMVRGVALPFVFVLAAITILERIRDSEQGN